MFLKIPCKVFGVVRSTSYLKKPETHDCLLELNETRQKF